jgi:GNAT superfamily N-acetyltransferase
MPSNPPGLRSPVATRRHANLFGRPGFERQLADWLACEGDRRISWLASLGDLPVGMASMLQYRRIPHPGRPDSRWGYVSNMFVREDFRGRGIGGALLQELLDLARARHYARLVLSPSHRATEFYRRAGLMSPDKTTYDRLLVRPAEA